MGMADSAYLGVIRGKTHAPGGGPWEECPPDGQGEERPSGGTGGPWEWCGAYVHGHNI